MFEASSNEENVHFFRCAVFVAPQKMANSYFMLWFKCQHHCKNRVALTFNSVAHEMIALHRHPRYSRPTHIITFS